MKNKVLFITYFFPPVGGSGVLRITKFVKYLPKFGYQPVVLTPRKAFYPVEDEALLKEISPDTEVHRVKYFEPAFWFKNRFWQSFLKYFLYKIFLVPDNQILWFLPAYLSARKIIKAENINIIFTSSSSYSDHLVALVLKKTLNIKWVADFRDEWTTSSYFKFPSFIHKNIAQLFEKSILKNADLVTTISEGMTESYSNILGKSKKIITLTNGYDEADFDKSQISNLKSQNENKKFRIVHVGTLYATRKADNVLKVFNELKLKNAQIELVGIGKRVPHKEAIRKTLAADVLLLILSPEDGPAVLTGKIFEYLAAKKPILALAPKDSGAAQLIEKLKVGYVADPNDTTKIKDTIKLIYQKWQNGKLKVPKVNLKIFTREYLTGKLAHYFTSVTNIDRQIHLCLIGNLASPQNQTLVQELLKKNYRISFITTKPAKVSGVKSYEIDNELLDKLPGFYFLRALGKIKKIIAEIQPDIVHGQDLIFAGIWTYLSGFHPYVVTPWGSDLNNYESFIGPEKYLIRQALKNSDLLTANSKISIAKAIHLGMDHNKTYLNYFGIDLNEFKPQKAESLRHIYQLGKAKIIFCPRSIAPIYNTDILIEALALVSKKTDVKLLLTYQNHHAEYLAKVNSLIRYYHLENRVIFLKNILFDTVPKLFALADIVVSITSSDGCSSAFLEAMAMEKKIVTTNLPIMKEWFIKNNLWLVPVRNAQKTADTIGQALKYPENKWQKIGQSNRALIRQKAEIKSNINSLDQLYRELL